ncbi:MAG: hypothetical protein KF803_08700 [Cyclobacteriaceae bacterium]|nr:hypothetical protein [Cyclobacteriaceae bacterium]
MEQKRFILNTFRTLSFRLAYETFNRSLNYGSVHLILGDRGSGRTTVANCFVKDFNDKRKVALVHCEHARGGTLLFKMCAAIIPDFDWPFIKTNVYGYMQRLRHYLLSGECPTRLIILDDFALKEYATIIELLEALEAPLNRGSVGVVIISTPGEYDHEFVHKSLFKKFSRLLYVSGKGQRMLPGPIRMTPPSIADINAIAKSKGLTDVKPLIGSRTIGELKQKLKKLHNQQYA